VVPFRLRDRDDDANRALLDAISASGRVFVSARCSRDVHDRVCIVSHRTHRDRIDECNDIVRSAAASIR
jgi:aromatic-L-amino-acid decarboxylase